MIWELWTAGQWLSYLDIARESWGVMAMENEQSDNPSQTDRPRVELAWGEQKES